jgi:hypothetical protein
VKWFILRSVAVRKKKGSWGGRRPGAGRKPVLKDPVSVTLDLEGSDFERLKAFAEARDTSVAALVRRAVQAHLKRLERK